MDVTLGCITLEESKLREERAGSGFGMTIARPDPRHLAIVTVVVVVTGTKTDWSVFSYRVAVVMNPPMREASPSRGL